MCTKRSFVPPKSHAASWLESVCQCWICYFVKGASLFLSPNIRLHRAGCRATHGLCEFKSVLQGRAKQRSTSEVEKHPSLPSCSSHPRHHSTPRTNNEAYFCLQHVYLAPRIALFLIGCFATTFNRSSWVCYMLTNLSHSPMDLMCEHVRLSPLHGSQGLSVKDTKLKAKSFLKADPLNQHFNVFQPEWPRSKRNYWSFTELWIGSTTSCCYCIARLWYLCIFHHNDPD